MKMIKWLPEAREDLQRLHEFLRPYSQKAATKAVSKLVDSADSLREFPEKGPPWDLEIGFRELIVTFGARGYVIRYRITDDELIIVRVWHALEGRENR